MHVAFVGKWPSAVLLLGSVMVNFTVLMGDKPGRPDGLESRRFVMSHGSKASSLEESFVREAPGIATM